LKFPTNSFFFVSMLTMGLSREVSRKKGQDHLTLVQRRTARNKRYALHFYVGDMDCVAFGIEHSRHHHVLTVEILHFLLVIKLKSDARSEVLQDVLTFGLDNKEAPTGKAS
jgi:hypothetical protein